MSFLVKLGVIGTSLKVNERRVPIHPDHLPRLPESVRKQLVFEESYGAPFGISDEEIARKTGGIAPRHELLADLGAVVLPKPDVEDALQQRHTCECIGMRRTLFAVTAYFGTHLPNA